MRNNVVYLSIFVFMAVFSVIVACTKNHEEIKSVKPGALEAPVMTFASPFIVYTISDGIQGGGIHMRVFIVQERDLSRLSELALPSAEHEYVYILSLSKIQDAVEILRNKQILKMRSVDSTQARDARKMNLAIYDSQQGVAIWHLQLFDTSSEFMSVDAAMVEIRHFASNEGSLIESR